MLAAPDSVIGKSLRTFLSIINEIDFIGSVNMAASVNQYFTENKPDILVLDADLVEYDNKLNLQTYLQDLQRINPNISIIVLVGGAIQHKAVLNCEVAQVVFKGEMGEILREKLRNYQHPQTSRS